MIVNRYIRKEILITFSVIVIVLLGVAISNRFVVYLAKTATGELPVDLVFQVIALYVPELLATLMPIGFFIAILFAQGRLHADSEMTVLSACGMGTSNVVKATLSIATILTIVLLTLTLWVIPHSTQLREQTLAKGEAVGMMHALLPGRFHVMADGRMVFYLEDKEEQEQSMKGVFIALLPQGAEQEWSVLRADSAQLNQNEDTQDYYLILKNGYRYTGVPGEAAFTEVEFEEHGWEVAEDIDPVPDFHRLKPSMDLWNSSNPGEVAELQWRFSIPLTTLILALWAVPLSRVRPRQGRYAKFLPAVILYILYYNLLTVSRRFLAKGSLSPWIGIWWVHGLFLLLALAWIAHESGWFRYMRLNRGYRGVA